MEFCKNTDLIPTLIHFPKRNSGRGAPPPPQPQRFYSVDQPLVNSCAK